LISRFFLILAALLFFTTELYAQADTTAISGRVRVGESRGRDFWLCFPQNARYGEARINLRLIITGDRDTRGIVTVPGIGFKREFNFAAQQIINVDLDSTVQITSSEQILKLGVHVEADNNIAVYGVSQRKASTDTYLALPTNTLGSTYRAVGYHPPETDNSFATQFNIVAVEDRTNVVITLTGDTRGGRRAGETFAVELNRGDVYTVQGGVQPGRRSDLTGSLVASNKPVAFFVGHTCAQVPREASFCDQLLEQSPPIPSWGRQFFIGRLEPKSSYAIRVIASENNTQVFHNNRLVARLNAGDYYENNRVTDNSFVTASKPVMVAQYATGSDADSVRVGDPFMVLVTPTEQFLNYYRFATPARGDWHHYINIVVPLEGLPSLRLDGAPVSSRFFKQIGISRYAIAQIELGYGAHSVSCDLPFGMYSYGFGTGTDNYDSYGNPAGQYVEAIPLTPDTLRPVLDLLSEDGNLSLNLIARDDRLFDLGLASITVIDSSNFRSPVAIPLFDQGTSQLPMTFRLRDTSSCAWMSLKLVDLAGNESYWVICRTGEGGVWTYTMTESRETICPSCRSWTVQFITTPSYTASNVTFEKPDWLKGEASYQDFSTRLSGGFAGLYVFPFSKEVVLAGGIGYSNYTGAVTAQRSSFVRDSILYGDSLGSRDIKLIEEFVTEASVNYLNLNGGVYYYFIPEKLYAYFGLATGFLIQSSYTETVSILHPATLEYTSGRSGGVREKVLSQGALPEPTAFQVALEVSPGLQFKLSQRVSLLTGAHLNLPIFDAVRDVNWHLMTFGLRVGLQYRH
jgi:hypothetical protein